MNRIFNSTCMHIIYNFKQNVPVIFMKEEGLQQVRCVLGVAYGREEDGDRPTAILIVASNGERNA